MVVASITVSDPASVGVDPEAIEELIRRARQEVEEGLLPACQIAVARHDKVVAFETLGAAAPDSRFVIFSATKPFVASVIWQLMAEGRIDPSQLVTDFIPEFGTNEKDAITVEQVMLHTSGFPHAPLGPPAWGDRDSRVEAFAKWRLNWEPGTRYEYHATSAHWVLAEIIERLEGDDFRAVVKRRVVDPLGLPGFALGVPIGRQDDINRLAVVGESPTSAEIEEITGIPDLTMETLTGGITDAVLIVLGAAENLAVGVPGGGGVATAADVVLFYQALLHNPGELWDPDILADATSRVRNRLPDPMLNVPANRSLGLVIAGDDDQSFMRGMGHKVSAGAFGHNGAGGQIAWADPASGLSFCYLTNGLDEHIFRQWRRGPSLSNRATACVK